MVSTLSACRKAPPPPTTPEVEIPHQYMSRAPEPDVDSDNLLNIAYGASVISRSGELNLESSAAHGIDGMLLTSWVSAPGAREETLVYSLLAPARVLRVGLTAPEGDQRSDSVRFEGSMDGLSWREIATVKPEETAVRQLVAATPVKAQFIRITSLTTHRYYLAARAFHVLGEEVAAPATPPFTGCWTANGQRVELTQKGARITGVVASDPPTYFDGGTDNRVGLVMWMQGPTWGYAALTRSPDGAHLTTFRFHEEVDSKNVGDAWFGDRCESNTPLKPVAPQAFLERAKRYSVFGLVFDPADRLVEDLSEPALGAAVLLLAGAPGQRFRIVARDFRRETPELNARHSAARLTSFRNALRARGIDTARIELVAAGDRWIGPPIGSTIQGMLASRIDIETIAR